MRGKFSVMDADGRIVIGTGKRRLAWIVAHRGKINVAAVRCTTKALVGLVECETTKAADPFG